MEVKIFVDPNIFGAVRHMYVYVLEVLHIAMVRFHSFVSSTRSVVENICVCASAFRWISLMD
jgi:hypothetical protein